MTFDTYYIRNRDANPWLYHEILRRIAQEERRLRFLALVKQQSGRVPGFLRFETSLKEVRPGILEVQGRWT